MQELEILLHHQPIDQPMFLEACAGAGKTFAIEHLVVRLLLHPDLHQRRTMEQIALVTFTRAAAADLRRRVQKNIRATSEWLSGSTLPPEAPPYLHESLLHTPAATLRRWLELAGYSLERAFIGTIHGFCRRLLIQFGNELSEGLLGEPEAPLAQGLERERILEFLRYGLSYSMMGRGQWQRLLGGFRGIGGLARALQYESSSLLRGGLTIGSWSEDMARLRATLATAPSRNPDEVIELWRSMVPNYRGMSARDHTIHADQLLAAESFAQALLDPSEGRLDALVRAGCPWASCFTESQRKQRQVEAPPAAELFLDWARSTLHPILKPCREPRLLLKRCALLMAPARKRWREQQGWRDPDELVMALHRCITQPTEEGASWKTRIAASLRTLIVDEFQDTDPQQWGIFEQLKEHLQLIVVGDPKQSIYAFRSADLYTYLEASTQFCQDEHWSLTRCYRSSAEVVEALNRILLLFEGFDLPKSGTRLPIPTTLPRPDPPAPLSLPACTWAPFVRPRGRSRRWPSTAWMREEILPVMRKHLLHLHQLGLPWREIAILVHDRYQAQEVAFALSQAGIPHFTARGRDWSSRQALFVMRDWIHVLCDPEDEHALVRLLASPLVGWTGEQLKSWRQEPLIHIIQKDLYEERSLLLEIGLQAALQHVLRIHWWSPLSPARTAELEALLRDLELLGEALAALEVSSGAKGLGWKWVIQDVLTQRIALPEQASPPPPDAVPIVTIHMSKGLEFEAVLALGISARTPYDPLNSPEEHEEVDAEKLRQLYVTLTRAKRHLWIPVLLDPDPPVLEPGTAAPLELFLARLANSEQQRPRQPLTQELSALGECSPELLMRWIQGDPPLVMGIHAPEEEISPLLTAPPSSSAPRLDRPLSLPPQRIWSSFSAEREHGRGSPFITEPAAAIDLPTGTVMGIALHEALQERVRRLQPLSEAWVEGLCQRHGLEVSILLFQEAVEAAMATPFCGEISLNHIPPSHRRSEVPFLLHDRSKTLLGWSGSIDVVASHQDALFALDWKSHSLGSQSADYSQENMAQCIEDGGYALQARLYLAALRARFPHLPILGFGFVFLRAARLGLPATVWIPGDRDV